MKIKTRINTAIRNTMNEMRPPDGAVMVHTIGPSRGSFSPVLGTMRTFATGATRNTDADKPDYEGFLSPLVIEAFGAYMHKHRKQADGKLRDSDNWQKGIPRDQYMKSAFRHFVEAWKRHRTSYAPYCDPKMEEALCALLFNVMGYLHECKKEARA